MPSPSKLLEEFQESLEELVTESETDGSCESMGFHRDSRVGKFKLMLTGAYKLSLGLTPGKVCHCGGSGVVNTRDWVDYGSTRVPMNQAWVCDTLNDGHCCKCGGELDEKFHVCQECGEDWHRKLEN